jgi:hypothetical protein
MPFHEKSKTWPNRKGLRAEYQKPGGKFYRGIKYHIVFKNATELLHF